MAVAWVVTIPAAALAAGGVFAITQLGSHLLVAAGDVRQDGSWAFWDVSDPERAVIIHLADERYDRLVIEVDDPRATAAIINQALAVGPSRSTTTG
jgi:hypothetical protein